MMATHRGRRLQNATRFGWKGARTQLTLVALVLALFAGSWLTPRDPFKQDLSSALLPPSTHHLFGTDQLGRDVLSRVLYGARVSLGASFVAIVLAGGVGVVTGFASGFVGGAFDNVMMRLLDAMMAFPGLLLALCAVVILGPGLLTAPIAVGITQIPIIARLARATILSEKTKLYVESGVAIGCSSWTLLVRHLAPNSLMPIVVQLSLMVADTVLAIAGLGFLGLGAQPPTPEWGVMLGESRLYLWQAPHLAIFPGLAVCSLALTFNLLGDSLRKTMDVRAGG